MKLLANENFPLDSVNYLRFKGYDIKAISNELSGISDIEVMQIAIHEERTILTFDRDYGELIFRLKLNPPMGVIYLRLDKYESDEPGKIIEHLFTAPAFDPANKLTVVSESSVRQRSF